MIGLYEITQRLAGARTGKPSPAGGRPWTEEIPPPLETIADEAPRGNHSEGTSGRPEQPATPSGMALKPPPPLPSLPNRWVLEIQKIAHHLSASAPNGEACQTILFSGIQRKAGTTTVSYIVAHQMAVEYGDQKVLYIDCRLKSANGYGINEGGTVINVGDPVDQKLFDAGTCTLRRISVRLGDGRSVAVVARWFRDFIDAARLNHRAIIIDAPPFFAAPETFSLAKASDSVVLVLRAGLNRYPAVNALVSDLDQLGISVLGTVLNYRQYPIPQWLLKFI